VALKTAQIGRCGELLVQYILLKQGIESAPMSTDSGIDLVAYAPNAREATTIQVKTNLKAKPGGGKGKAQLDWWIEEDSPAELVAFVDLSVPRVWMFKTEELPTLNLQNPKNRFHLCMCVDPTLRPRKTDRLIYAYEFEQYLFENRVHKLFGI
jgi:hypothetical protein